MSFAGLACSVVGWRAWRYSLVTPAWVGVALAGHEFAARAFPRQQNEVCRRGESKRGGALTPAEIPGAVIPQGFGELLAATQSSSEPAEQSSEETAVRSNLVLFRVGDKLIVGPGQVVLQLLKEVVSG